MRNKIRSFGLMMLAILLALSGPIYSICNFSGNASALSESRLNMFAQNDILFYDPDETDCEEAQAGTLSGNSIGEKIWNYFVGKGITNPAIIAGIMGNFAVESGGHVAGNADPFVQYDNNVYGIFQSNNPEFKKMVEDAFGSSYWHTSSTSSTAPQDVIDSATIMELDWLMENAGKDMGNSAFYFFDLVQSSDISNIVTYTEGIDGAASFAELFLITVERAVGGEYTLSDSKLRTYLTTKLYPSASEYKYQSGAQRVKAARDVYEMYADKATPTTEATASTAFNDDGWLKDDAIPGYTKEEVSSERNSDVTYPLNSYTTDGKPNKILLHNTEGTQSGLAAYPVGSTYPSHFTIDLVNKKVSQHMSIYRPANGIVAHDKSAGVQIEIVGFSGKDSPCGDGEYCLQNFGDDEWDYLVVLLNAISETTGIPLVSNGLDWASENPTRLSVSEFESYSGVIGHMHAPENTHNDPGDIWKYITEAMARNPSASSFSAAKETCSTGGQLASGGYSTVAEADAAIMEPYRNLTPDEYATYNINSGSGCVAGMLHNCVSFSRYFVSRYSNVDLPATTGNGCDIVKNMKDLPGMTYGGTTPKVYAIFSTGTCTYNESGVATSWGHTGVVLGIDTEKNTIIVGEAGCNSDASWTGAHEYKLSDYTDGSYTYVYIDNITGL